MIQLNGITWTNPRGYLPLVASTEAWRKLRPDVSVHWEQLPWYQFEERVLSSLASGDGRYDLVMYDHPWTGQLAGQGWLVPWNDLVPQTYLDDLRDRVVTPSTESYERGGKLWALPLDSACHASVSRADLTGGCVLPSTWEQIEEWAKVHHDPPHRYGLVLSLEGVLGHCLFLSMMAGLNHPPYLDADEPICDRAAAEYVLTLLKSLLRFTPPGSETWGPWDIYDHMVTHDDVSYCPSIFGYVNYFGKGGRSSQLRLGTVPGFSGGQYGRPILGGVGLGIASASKALSEATEYGKFLMSEDTQLTIFPANSGQPSTRAAWANSTLNTASCDFYRDLAPGMAKAYVRPTYQSFHALELAGGRALQAWWENRCTLPEVLRALHAGDGK
jgi:multiple sugar transport system substrate-binding protein